MLNRFTKLRLVDLFYNLADGEIKTEALRQVLAEKYEFEPYAAFKRIAGAAPSPYLSSADLQDFLAENNIDITSREAQQLLALFDTDRDSRISFSEFLNVILPKDDPKLRQRATLRPSYNLEEGERLPYDVEYGLARILEQELNNFLKIENLKQQLSLCYDFSINNAFKTLDPDAKGYLIPEDISDFMEENGRLLDDKELTALFRKIDQDLDGIITHKEFGEAMFSYQSDLSISKKEIESKGIQSSPKGSIRASGELKKSIISPHEGDERDLEYNDYLIESKIRSSKNASPRREDNLPERKDYYTPAKSERKFDQEELAGQYSSKKKSPLKGNEEEEFVRALKEIINNSKMLESMKNDLALRVDFNLFDAYRYFNVDGRSSYISQKDFQEGLAALNLFPTRDEISLFFKRFDTDSDGFLRFTDFHNIVSPKATDFAKLIDNRKPRYVQEDDQEIFTRETQRLLARVLDLAITNEVQAESIRQRLSRRPLFNLFDAFKALDKYEQGFIVIEDLKEILFDYGIFASTKDLNILAERFKGGSNFDGKISYSDFVKELSPKSIRSY